MTIELSWEIEASAWRARAMVLRKIAEQAPSEHSRHALELIANEYAMRAEFLSAVESVE